MKLTILTQQTCSACIQLKFLLNGRFKDRVAPLDIQYIVREVDTFKFEKAAAKYNARSLPCIIFEETAYNFPPTPGNIEDFLTNTVKI